MPPPKRRRSLRDKVFARDHGVCIDCGLDTEAYRIRVEAMKSNREQHAAAWEVLEREGFKKHTTLWESEHDIALDEGGLDELSNLMTRCRPCHREKTSEQSARKAKRRKIIGVKFLETQKRKGRA